jgi:hypothetical protein
MQRVLAEERSDLMLQHSLFDQKQELSFVCLYTCMLFAPSGGSAAVIFRLMLLLFLTTGPSVKAPEPQEPRGLVSRSFFLRKEISTICILQLPRKPSYNKKHVMTEGAARHFDKCQVLDKCVGCQLNQE